MTDTLNAEQQTADAVALGAAIDATGDLTFLRAAIDTAKDAIANPPPETAVDKPTLTLADRAILAAAADEVAAQMGARVAQLRADLFTALAAVAKATDTKGVVDAKLPDGTKVATFSLNQPTDKAKVVNDLDFAAWVETNHPTEVDYVTVVRPTWQKTLLEKGVTLDLDTGQVIKTDTGEVIPGLKAFPGGDPTNTSLRFAKDGREKVAGAFAGRSLAEVLGYDQVAIAAAPAAPAAPEPAGPVIDGTVVDATQEYDL